MQYRGQEKMKDVKALRQTTPPKRKTQDMTNQLLTYELDDEQSCDDC